MLKSSDSLPISAQRSGLPYLPLRPALEEKPETAKNEICADAGRGASTAQAGESLRDADASRGNTSLSRQKEASEKEAILRALQINGMNKSKSSKNVKYFRTLLYKSWKSTI